MSRPDLSILIPARCEMFLTRTVENALANIEGDTEIIVVCDGNWSDPPLKDNPRVHIIYHSQPVGQRAATNEAAKLSRARFIMKADAHCAFDKGFDVKMMAECKYEWTMIPRMYNLHAFNWKCKKCGNETYQGPTPTKCDKCTNTTDFERVIIWKEKRNPTSDFMRFDKDLHFQYWMDFKKRPEAQGDICPTMSLIGACWMMHRERYWELDGMDEEHGSWGQMGTEISCKSWLSGGALMVNKKTWFAHLFRTQGGDFGFPYPNPGINKARQRSKELWLEGKWPKAKHDLAWLIDKFSPVPDWGPQERKAKHGNNLLPPDQHRENIIISDSNRGGVGVGDKVVSKGIVYYTDNRIPQTIEKPIQDHLLKARANGVSQIVSIALKKATTFGDLNLAMPDFERGFLTMFKQILIGIENCDSDIIFLAEHDCAYHPSHFKFSPPKDDIYYYNENVYQINSQTGKTVYFRAKRASQLCGYREHLLRHYRKRVELVEKNGFTMKMGFEPGTHRRDARVDDYKSDSWRSEFPNIDIKHGKNLTRAKWSPKDFRSQRNCVDWQDVEGEIPGWGKGIDICHTLM